MVDFLVDVWEQEGLYDWLIWRVHKAWFGRSWIIVSLFFSNHWNLPCICWNAFKLTFSLLPAYFFVLGLFVCFLFFLLMPWFGNCCRVSYLYSVVENSAVMEMTIFANCFSFLQIMINKSQPYIFPHNQT